MFFITGSAGLGDVGVAGPDDASAGAGRPIAKPSNWVAAKNTPQEKAPEKEPETMDKMPEVPQKTE